MVGFRKRRTDMHLMHGAGDRNTAEVQRRFSEDKTHAKLQNLWRIEQVSMRNGLLCQDTGHVRRMYRECFPTRRMSDQKIFEESNGCLYEKGFLWSPYTPGTSCILHNYHWQRSPFRTRSVFQRFFVLMRILSENNTQRSVWASRAFPSTAP